LSTPWYKQFWPWFLILLPLSAVIGSFATLIVFSNNSVEIVVDDYYKKGKAINMDLKKFEQAKAQGLSFAITLDDNTLYLQKQSGELASQAALTLAFYHPTMSARDFSLQLVADANGRYSAAVEQLPEGKWQLLLQPFDQSWKMKAQGHFPLAAPLVFE